MVCVVKISKVKLLVYVTLIDVLMICLLITIYPLTQNKISGQIHMASSAVMLLPMPKERGDVIKCVCLSVNKITQKAVNGSVDKIVYNHFGCKK